MGFGTRTVRVDVDVDDVLDELDREDFSLLASRYGRVCIARSDLEEIGRGLRRGDLDGVLLLLDRIVPSGFRHFVSAFGPVLEARRPC